VPISLYNAISMETGRLPGEVARLFSVLPKLPADVTSLPEDAVTEYRVEAVQYFTGRIEGLLDKVKFNDGRQEAELRRFNAEFAQRVFSGHRLNNPPKLWQSSGLVVFNVSAKEWRVVCPAAQKAVVEHLSSALVLPDIIAVLVCHVESLIVTCVRRQTKPRSGVLWSWP